MYKFKKKISFSNDGRNVIDAKVGDEHELNDYLSKAFLAKGIVAEVAKKSNNDSEDKIPNDENDVDLMAIFDEDPERLTVPELKEICKELNIKFHHASKEAKLIELIKEAKAE